MSAPLLQVSNVTACYGVLPVLHDVSLDIHPREIDPGHPRLEMSRSRRFKTYVNLSTTHGKLQAIMAEGRVTNFGDWIAQLGDTLPVVPQAAS